MSFFVFLYFSFLLFLCHPASSRQPLCHDVERSALLLFKESFSIKKSVSLDPSAYCKTELWNLEEDSDCCLWDGVKCNEDTGYVIELDLGSSCLYGPINSTSTLFNLVHLQWLSLADNIFNFSKIPSEFKNLSNLSHLNLSWSAFSGQIPSEILELSKLESLALDRNDDLELQQPGLESLIQKLTNLRVLDLDIVNISSSLPHVLTDLSSLNFLSLANCNLKGNILWSLGNLNNLTHLDLSGNKFQGIILPSLNKLANLVYLDMSSCCSGQQDPSSLTNLTQLYYLDLSSNNFSRPSSSLFWIGKNTKLAHLGISSINIGEFPFWLMNLTHLTYLSMSHNQLTGAIPFWLMNLNQLSTLYLSSNQLQGPIPSSFVELNKLESLDLSSNNLSGTMELEMFLQLKSLRSLYLSSNRLSLLTNLSINTSSRKFQRLRLGSCNLRSFPDFLRYQDQLVELDLSSNNISGQIPGWFLNISANSLRYLNLSHNLLTGIDQQPVVLPWTSLYSLDLSFNKLQGPLPISTISTIGVYLVSNNNLSGELSPWICKLNSLQALDLSNNSLSSKLPQCLSNFNDGLSMLNLQNNKFRGSIPQTFMNGTRLRMIDLSHNMFGGKFQDHWPIVQG